MSQNKASTISWADASDEVEETPQVTKPTGNLWQKGNPFGITVQQKPSEVRQVNHSEFPEPKESRSAAKPKDSGREENQGPKGGRTDQYYEHHSKDNYERETRHGNYLQGERNYGGREGKGYEGYNREDRGRNYNREDNYDRKEGFRSFNREPRDMGTREGGYNRPQREPRPPREPIPFPENPPFTAYVGNLDYNITEDELSKFFASECKITSIHLATDKNNRFKGHGYAEFEDLESLKNAIAMNGRLLFERPLRVDVAEASKHDSERRLRNFEKTSYEEAPFVRGNADFGRQDQIPRERPKLDLKKKSPDTIRPNDEPDKVYQTGSKGSNPFGDAKPRDEYAIQKKIEEERKKREDEQKKREEEQKRQEEEQKKQEEQNKEEAIAHPPPQKTMSEQKQRPPKGDFVRGEKRVGGDQKRERRSDGERKEGSHDRPRNKSFNKSPGDNQPFVRGSKVSGGKDDKSSKNDKPRERTDRPPKEPEVLRTKVVDVTSQNLFAALGEVEEN